MYLDIGAKYFGDLFALDDMTQEKKARALAYWAIQHKHLLTKESNSPSGSHHLVQHMRKKGVDQEKIDWLLS